MKARADVADMLRAGHTYRHIAAQTGASHHTITAVRKTLDIPVPDGRAGAHQRRSIRDQVADMLRAGATYRDIEAKLKVSSSTITGARREYDIPMPPGRGTNKRIPETDTQIADMLRNGATSRDVAARLRVSPSRIADVRRTHNIPIPDTHSGPYTVRTPAQTLAHYSVPAADGHTHWKGPGGNRPQIWHHSRSLSGLRVAFQAHHGREPVGRVTRGCHDPACITGAHLTDHTIRQANHRADQAFEHIFGPTP